MEKAIISRGTFIKRTAQIGALTIAGSMVNGWLNPATAAPGDIDEALMSRLLKTNDEQVPRLLKELKTQHFARKIGFDFAVLAAAFCSPKSAYYKNGQVRQTFDHILKILRSNQSPDGTVSIGNLESPPDTAFLLEPLSAATFLLQKQADPETKSILQNLDSFLKKAAEGLCTGGLHTPNHRWVISAALSRLNQIYPNQRYIDRIEDWLGEGVYQDADGNFPERSRIYSHVEDEAFITMGRLLNKPSLYEVAKKNLETNYYYMEPNGDLVTTDSRRQDQYMEKDILPYYLQYRYLAILNNNGHFAAITRFIEQMPGFKKAILSDAYFHFLENPLLQKALPPPTPLPVQFDKLIGQSHMARIRNGKNSTTIFGGIDWPIIIASGRSNSPNFFSFRKGNAHLKYMRLSTEFFGLGYFYSEGIKKTGTGYELFKKWEVPYYQPLPQHLRKADGDYNLEPSVDGRFWNKMDFDQRPVSNVKTLEIRVQVQVENGRNQLDFSITGTDGISVTLELCFREGGFLKGVVADQKNSENHFLEQGFGAYSVGNDQIRFGPGMVKSRKTEGLDGERYSTHFGSLRTKGSHVYISGSTPFKHQLIIE